MSQTITREYLEFQSDRIERVLASHRVPARVEGGSVTPRAIRFQVAPALGAKLATIRNLSEELALALNAPDVRIARQGDRLALEVPRPDAEPVYLLGLMRGLQTIPPYTACLGIAEDGRPLLARLSSPEAPHILVAGTTGSGKTELIRSIVLSLALTHRQSQLQIALIDPKSRGLTPLAGLRHLLAPLAVDEESALALLQRLVLEMERRDLAHISSPRILIVVDEMLDLLDTKAGAKPLEAALTRLTQRGREAGLHVIAGAQKPSTAVLGPLLKANFPVRLVGRVTSVEDARVATGQSGSGAEKLVGRGDFVAVACGALTHFQAAWVPQRDWAEVQRLLAV